MTFNFDWISITGISTIGAILALFIGLFFKGRTMTKNAIDMGLPKNIVPEIKRELKVKRAAIKIELKEKKDELKKISDPAGIADIANDILRKRRNNRT